MPDCHMPVVHCQAVAVVARRWELAFAVDMGAELAASLQRPNGVLEKRP